MKRMKSLMVAALLAPALAMAQPKTADDWYKEGENQYNLGEFDKAAEAFKQGFAAEADASKKPAYLYNVAQAYRQGNKCKDAAFFYKRYLSLKDQDTVKPLKPEKRAEIEQRITELEECAKNQESIANKPPNNTLSPGTGGTGTGGTGTGTGDTGTGGTGAAAGGTGTGGTTVGQAGGGEGEGDEGEGDGEDDGEGVSAAAPLDAPKVISARFIGGGAMVSAGDLDIGMRTTIGVIAGYPVVTQANGHLLVDAGIAFGFTPIPYENNMTGANATATLVSTLANAGVTYFVTPKIGVRGDIGLGILSLGGISEMGNPFTENAAGTSGALTMFNFRFAASADYVIAPNLVATVTPFGYSYSPAKEGLRSDISTITAINFMVGVGYRM